jgi:hypothetical protein
MLTIKLANGGTLTAAVTDDTEIECDDDADDDHGHHRGHGRGHGDGHEDENEDCGTDALVAGTKVLEAELKVRDGEAVWKEVELLKP